jgi:hypothetical protein
VNGAGFGRCRRPGNRLFQQSSPSIDKDVRVVTLKEAAWLVTCRFNAYGCRLGLFVFDRAQLLAELPYQQRGHPAAFMTSACSLCLWQPGPVLFRGPLQITQWQFYSILPALGPALRQLMQFVVFAVQQALSLFSAMALSKAALSLPELTLVSPSPKPLGCISCKTCRGPTHKTCSLPRIAP